MLQSDEEPRSQALTISKSNMEAAVTEGTEWASNKLGVCPRVVSLQSPGKYQSVLPLGCVTCHTIKPKSNLCELQEVKVLRSTDIEHTKTEKAHAQRHHVQANTEDRKECDREIPECINLE